MNLDGYSGTKAQATAELRSYRSSSVGRGMAESPAPRSPDLREDLLETATIFAEKILDHRLRARDGTITWRRPNRSAAKEPIPVGPTLYDGLPGVAIFFAALARVRGRPRYRDLSFEIVAPLRRLLGRLAAQPRRAAELRIEIGGLSGIGGQIYALLLLGELLDAPELLTEACRLTPWITPERIAADRKLDLVAGATGAILALLALDRRVPGAAALDPAPLDVAMRCARHLVRSRVDLPEGTAAWLTNPIHPPLNGFAHGSAGICCALLQVFEKTGDEELLRTARRGWAFERATYSEERKNWRDLTVAGARFLNQWCFGAPGIAMGRLLTLRIVDDEQVRAEIRSGLQTTADPELTAADHVCCGNMGRVEVLLHAARELGSDGLPGHDLEASALELARCILARAEAAGSPRWMVDCDLFDPSFFSGAAGFGYTLLRLARPESGLPSLLAFE